MGGPRKTGAGPSFVNRQIAQFFSTDFVQYSKIDFFPKLYYNFYRKKERKTNENNYC